MKNLLSLLLITFASVVIVSGQAAAEYKAENAGWLVNLDEAYKISEKTGKPIMANFTGSDWCGWCKRLTAAVFSKPEFKSWADKNVVLLELDYPRGKQLPNNIVAQNQNLQQAFGIGGYPTVWLFKMKKNNDRYNIVPMGKTGYAPEVAQFTDAMDAYIKDSKVKGI
jgi:thiol-disulfide isomerase/thioredoxin